MKLNAIVTILGALVLAAVAYGRWPGSADEKSAAEPASAAVQLLSLSTELAASAATTAPTPARVETRAAIAEPVIGSEGYGLHIQKAMVSGDAVAAMQAVGWLNGCATLAARMEANEHLRGSTADQSVTFKTRQDDKAPAQTWVPYLLERMLAEQRRCQTVTPDLTGLLPALALNAMRGKLAGAALAYANAVPEPPEALLPDLEKQLRKDAEEGDWMTALVLATRPPARISVSELDRLVYMLESMAFQPGGPSNVGPAAILLENALGKDYQPDPVLAARAVAIALPRIRQVLSQRAGPAAR